MAAPTFPDRPLARGEEGWVILNFMIDEDGKAFEPMVVDAMGDDLFVDAARKALEDSRFAPASLGGRPVRSSKTLRYTFVLENHENAARPAFVSSYSRLVRLVSDDEEQEARAELERLEEQGAHSLYEDAYLNLGKYYYAVKYGTPEEQMAYLTKALFFDDETTYKTYLPEQNARSFWPQLFVLQAQNKRFAEALTTYEIIRAIGAEEAMASLADTVGQIRKLETDDSAYAIRARTDQSGSWTIDLFKDEFYLDKLEADIDEIKLRCEKKFVFFEFDADTQYQVPSEFGRCSLEVLGDADTGFELVQL